MFGAEVNGAKSYEGSFNYYYYPQCYKYYCYIFMTRGGPSNRANVF